MGCTHISRKNSCRQPWDWGWSSSIGNPSTALAAGVGQGSCEVPAELQSQPCRAKPFVCFSPVGSPSSVPSLTCPEQAGRETCSRCTVLGAKRACGSTASFQAAPGNMCKKDGLLLKMWPQGRAEHFPSDLIYLTSF